MIEKLPDQYRCTICDYIGTKDRFANPGDERMICLACGRDQDGNPTKLTKPTSWRNAEGVLKGIGNDEPPEDTIRRLRG